MEETLGMDVWLDARTYLRFTWFDTMLRTRRWVRPVVFAVFFCVLSIISFSMRTPGGQGTLLGVVLLAVGLLLPLSFFIHAYRTLQKRARALKLVGQSKRFAYHLQLLEQGNGLRVTTAGDEVQVFPWASMHGVWRRPQVVYLYVEAGKTYILPRQEDARQWQTILDHLLRVVPKSKYHT